jgi:NAD(P) transhydrogenase
LLTVDEHFRTNVPHIYAAGDVIGFPALASTSMEQARIAVCHAFDRPYKTKMSAVLPYVEMLVENGPTCLSKTDPPPP